MIKYAKIVVFWGLITWISFPFAESAGLTCLKWSNKDQKDIKVLTDQWTASSVSADEKKRTVIDPPKDNKDGYRIDRELLTSEGYALYRIQSGKYPSKTHASLQIMPNVPFGAKTIQDALRNAVKDCKNAKLDDFLESDSGVFDFLDNSPGRADIALDDLSENSHDSILDGSPTNEETAVAQAEESSFSTDMIQTAPIHASARSTSHAAQPRGFQFVSCGDLGVESMAFGELVNVYDANTWFGLLLTVPMVAMVLKYVGSRVGICDMSITRNAHQLVKVLLDQGDPFRSRLIESNPIRLIAAAVMLTGIVLSNGYRNTNVYNLILPRNPFTIDKFQQLIDKNFTVYSKTGSIEFDVEHECRNLTIYQHMIENTNKGNSRIPEFLLKSQIFLTYQEKLYSSERLRNLTTAWDILWEIAMNTAYSSTQVFTAFMSHETFENQTKNLHRLVMHSSLYPAHFYNYSVARFRGKNRAWYKHEFEKLAKSRYRQREATSLYEFLRKCNKSALILPASTCKQYAIQLQRERLNANVGKETYFQATIVFDIKGLIPLSLVKRARNFRESGIQERWMGFLERLATLVTGDRDNAVMKSQEPTGAKLDGHILVIFAVLGIGLLAAFAAFQIERFSPICTYFWMKTDRDTNRKDIASFQKSSAKLDKEYSFGATNQGAELDRDVDPDLSVKEAEGADDVAVAKPTSSGSSASPGSRHSRFINSRRDRDDDTGDIFAMCGKR